jgi:hypothetical protein
MKTKHLIPVALLLAVGVLLTGCGKSTPSAADKAAAAKPYPLAVCVVSGEKLGSMGAPFVFVHQGQEIKLCCGGCEDDFKKEPAKFLAKLAKPAEPKK